MGNGIGNYYEIIYKPRKDNIPADTHTLTHCGTILHKEKLYENHLCHPGITGLAHFVKVRNLPYSMEDVKKICTDCPVCARWKPWFYKPE